MRVKPAPERMVRDPMTGQLLPQEGRDVPDNLFWRRRLRDGDVEVEAGAQEQRPPAARRQSEE